MHPCWPHWNPLSSRVERRMRQGGELKIKSHPNSNVWKLAQAACRAVCSVDPSLCASLTPRGRGFHVKALRNIHSLSIMGQETNGESYGTARCIYYHREFMPRCGSLPVRGVVSVLCHIDVSLTLWWGWGSSPGWAGDAAARLQTHHCLSPIRLSLSPFIIHVVHILPFLLEHRCWTFIFFLIFFPPLLWSFN